MTDHPRTTWREVEHLTPEQRQWLLRLCDAAANDCKSRQAAAKYIGVTLDELASLDAGMAESGACGCRWK